MCKKEKNKNTTFEEFMFNIRIVNNNSDPNVGTESWPKPLINPPVIDFDGPHYMPNEIPIDEILSGKYIPSGCYYLNGERDRLIFPGDFIEPPIKSHFGFDCKITHTYENLKLKQLLNKLLKNSFI